MSKQINVIKRDGSKEPYDVSKIKKSIEFAVDGQGVNPLHLEATLDHVIKNNVKTSEIQENVIRHALQLATPRQPKWVNVAGRALAMQYWADFKLRGKSFYEIVQYNIKKGEYSKELNDFYSEEDIARLGELIDHTRDLAHSHSSLITVKKKYLGKYELNQHMHMVTSMRFGQYEPAETRIEFVSKLYDMLSLRKISLATPFMSNLRKGGNVASCFILAIEDDLDSIYDNIKRIAQISKNGGGLGIYLGYVRAKGSMVGGYENAAGTVVQWIKVINDTLVAVNQSFVADTEIVTDSGLKKIADIKVGDLVKTHTGEFKSVTGVKSRENDNPVYKVSTEIGDTYVTEGHPVYVVDKVDGLSKEKIISGEIKPYWIDAKDITDRHMILKPV